MADDRRVRGSTRHRSLSYRDRWSDWVAERGGHTEPSEPLMELQGLLGQNGRSLRPFRVSM